MQGDLTKKGNCQTRRGCDNILLRAAKKAIDLPPFYAYSYLSLSLSNPHNSSLKQTQKQKFHINRDFTANILWTMGHLAELILQKKKNGKKVRAECFSNFFVSLNFSASKIFIRVSFFATC
jgi:hypothetical protein